MLAAGLMASSAAAGHAVAGSSMFYRPIKSAITNELHAGVLTGMWHLITIHFSSAAIALLVLGAQRQGAAVAWLIAAQFAGYAAVYLAISLRLGGALEAVSVDSIRRHRRSGCRGRRHRALSRYRPKAGRTQ
jgi:hypothetical protein